jgi:hypothetical protein
MLGKFIRDPLWNGLTISPAESYKTVNLQRHGGKGLGLDLNLFNTFRTQVAPNKWQLTDVLIQTSGLRGWQPQAA